MNPKKSPYRNLVLISQLGIHIMVPTFLCLFIGIWLDEKFHTWFTVPLLFLGILSGGRNAYILAMESIRQEKEQKDHEAAKRESGK